MTEEFITMRFGFLVGLLLLVPSLGSGGEIHLKPDQALIIDGVSYREMTYRLDCENSQMIWNERVFPFPEMEGPPGYKSGADTERYLHSPFVMAEMERGAGKESAIKRCMEREEALYMEIHQLCQTSRSQDDLMKSLGDLLEAEDNNSILESAGFGSIPETSGILEVEFFSQDRAIRILPEYQNGSAPRKYCEYWEGIMAHILGFLGESGDGDKRAVVVSNFSVAYIRHGSKDEVIGAVRHYFPGADPRSVWKGGSLTKD